MRGADRARRAAERLVKRFREDFDKPVSACGECGTAFRAEAEQCPECRLEAYRARQVVARALEPWKQRSRREAL